MKAGSCVNSGASGSATPVAAPKQAAIAANQEDDEDVFALANRLSALLEGKSYRTCFQALTLAGSLRGIRCINANRPIGLTSLGATKVVPKAPTPKRGTNPTAAWKQTAAYKQLTSERLSVITELKSLKPEDPSKKGLIEKMRGLEQSLKALHSPKSGEV